MHLSLHLILIKGVWCIQWLGLLQNQKNSFQAMTKCLSIGGQFKCFYLFISIRQTGIIASIILSTGKSNIIDWWQFINACWFQYIICFLCISIFKVIILNKFNYFYFTLAMSRSWCKKLKVFLYVVSNKALKSFPKFDQTLEYISLKGFLIVLRIFQYLITKNKL